MTNIRERNNKIKTMSTKSGGIAVASKKAKCIQGRHANSAGQRLENFVEDVLVERGVFPVLYSKWENGTVNVPSWVRKVLYKQAPYTKLWGTNGRSDFLLVAPSIPTTRIDARGQNIAGSVEEKAPYLMETAEKCYPEHQVIIVLDGAGVKPEIRSWMEARAASIKHKTVRVMNREQFVAWARTV